MVLYSKDKSALYHKLAVLEELAKGQSPSHAKLHFHNFVNNADLVPRLLGTSLDSVHGVIEGYIPAMKVRVAQGLSQRVTFCLLAPPLPDSSEELNCLGCIVCIPYTF